MVDKTLLDEIIIGRVEPHIYAFTTNTIPNYLKVGDTYRPVSVRLQEWREHFPELTKQFEGTAKVNDDVYFRDFSVHQFLETDKHRERLLPTDLPTEVYYSREFFKNATADDVTEAIADIEKDYTDNSGKYQFYNAENRLTETFTFARTENYPIRPNQEKTVKAFKTARDNGHKNLLMYAVMRFGKSFTSMCCAVEMKAKLVVIVSAKADVRLEWKKTVESHVKFAEYDFISSDELSRNNHIITEKLSQNRRVAVFLTLQDLQGDIIKDKHQEVFGQPIDLLLVDETHFGARAEKYGAVLKTSGYEKDVKNKKDEDDFVDVEDADTVVKTLSADTTIHLSGTPYRILMGSEFKKEDIIAFYQFTDIVDDQKAWDKAHILDDNYKEWDNPYYGFPQMVRFAFHPNESSRKRLEELKKLGTTYAFSALFKPQSIKKVDSGLHKKFKYEQEILDLLEVIDGSKNDDNILGFLDYDKIKDGKMCRHIVIVLPYCASCDALETLIKDNADKFRNLNGYKIINISGVDNPSAYSDSNAIKAAVRNAEANGEKTITLTVNRMLTGSTVPEWDTMLYLKDTASPQEYDQAVFRLQNQYIKTYVDDNGDTIKYNMKPQTLLVDFMPNRMFVMQETKSKIYNANVETGGNSELESRIQKELRISPIVTINADKIVEVKAADILTAVSNYQKDKGIKDEALETPVDLSLLEDDFFRSVIEQENEIGAKSGLSVPAHESSGEDDDESGNLDVPDGEAPDNDDETGANSAENGQSETTTADEQRKQERSLTKKIQSYYVRILLFAFITKDRVISVSDIIDKFDSEDNYRIAKNNGLYKQVLTLIQQKMDKFKLSDLDYRIQDLNDLSQSDMSPEDKANVAVKKFGKLGDAIVITPSNICNDMVNLFPDDFMREVAERHGRILDIAGTSGEYAVALCKKLTTLGIDKTIIENMIYTIPKSSICYELTRKLYEMLGLNVANIAKEFIATDLLEVKNGNHIDYDKIKALLIQNKPFDTIKLTDEPEQGETDMIKFDAVVGNPPYHESTTDQSAQGKPVYDKIVNIAKAMEPRYITNIIPSRWFAGGMGLDAFRADMILDKRISDIISFANGKDCFPDISTGGICIFLWDKNHNGNCRFITRRAGTAYEKERNLSKYQFVIRDNTALDILEKIETSTTEFISSKVSSINVFNFSSKSRGTEEKLTNDDYELLSSNGFGFVSKDTITDIEMANKYKVIVSQVISEHAAEPDKNGMYKLLSSLKVLRPKQVCTFSYLVVSVFDDMNSANNCSRYLSTKFARFMILQAVSSIHLTKDKFVFVPMQNFTAESDIDWSKSVPEIDKQLYAKYNLDESEIAFIESMIKPME
ncbi:MAG: Eco57I restriction-modification methylase domain-containing protein [Clostridia bacterium]|nr:Eco57I restriction-modification methylase domain-containing protein [Clostridia bacterium]MBR1675758.1 Eco57I restriction-modification methylase domain-containing protein [Clostridia bacterium]